MRNWTMALVTVGLLAAISSLAGAADRVILLQADTAYGAMTERPDLRKLLDRHDPSGPPALLSTSEQIDAPLLEYAGSTLWNSIIDVVVQGRYAYCVAPEGLLILDMTDPAQPHQVSQCYLHGQFGNDLEVRGQYVYAADGDSGFAIVDVSNPASPVAITKRNKIGYARDVEVSGDYVYVSCFDFLHIFDISDPYQPVEVGTDSPRIPGARASEASGDYLFVASGTLGLYEVNVTYPWAPFIMHSYPESAVSEVVETSGGYAYTENNSSALFIWDIINPATPEFVGTRNAHSVAFDIKVSDGLLYESGDTRLIIADIFHPPPWPHQDMVWDSMSNALGLTLDGDYIYVADGQQRLNVLRNYGTSKMPSRVGSFETPDYIERVNLSGDIALVRDFTWMPRDSWALHLVDLRNPSAPTPVGKHQGRGKIYDAEGQGDYVYVADNVAGLQTLDISDPAAPIVVSELPGMYAYDLALEPGQAYLAGPTGLQILDLTQPMNPTPLNALGGFGKATVVATSGDFVYLATDSMGFQIVDVSSPENPVALGHYTLPGIADIAVQGTYAYVTNGSGLVVMDVSDPQAPSPAGQYYPISRSMGVAVQGPYAYVAAGSIYQPQPGVWMFDITDPSKPTLVSIYPSAGLAWDVAIKGANLLVADYYGFVSLTTHLEYGDANADGSVSVADVRYLVNYLFGQGPAPLPTLFEGDADCNGVVNMVDAVYLVNYIFRAGPPPC